jgi:transglutaminase-like putative cysteine protease
MSTTRTSVKRPGGQNARTGVVAGAGARPWVDIGVVLLLSIIGIVGFSTSFDDAGYLIAGIGGLAVGSAVALLAFRLRFGVVVTILTGIVAFFLFGSAIAVPEQAIAGFVPTLGSLAALAVGTVNGWADIITLRAPVSLPDYVKAVPYVAGWVVALVGATLALRWLPRHSRTAWRSSLLLVGPTLLYLAGVLMGTSEPYFAAIRGIAFAVVALVWLGWRRSRAERVSVLGTTTLLRKRIIGTAIIVVVAVAIGAVGGAVFAPAAAHRFVLREEVQPPFEPLNYASPFAGFREYTKTLKTKTLFTVTGLRPDERIRLATMDSYNGVLWNVAGAQVQSAGSGSFNLVGRSIPKPPLATAGAPSKVTITIGDYDDVWLPDVGYPNSLDFTAGTEDPTNLRYNASTGTAVLTTGLKRGATYSVTAETQKVPDIDSLANTPIAAVPLPPVSTIPDIVTTKAQDIAGSQKSPAARMEKLTTTLANTGYLSHGTGSDSVPSSAGQGADRMVTLFGLPRLIGDQEQYATALALMARSFNYPARVVMGFAPKVKNGDSGPIAVKGSDVTAWVEVAFKGVGWVPFDPTPTETDVPVSQVPQPQSVPQPQVRQPPRTQQQQDDLVTGVDIAGSKSKNRHSAFGIPGWVVTVGLSVLVPLLLIFVPLLIIAALKLRRRRRRRAAASGDMAAAGAWDEVLDQYTELGYRVPERLTRIHVAGDLERQLGNEPSGSLVVLADRADEAVFSGRDVDLAQLETLWANADAAVGDARRRATPFRRLVARYRVSSASRWFGRISTRAAAAADLRREQKSRARALE